MADPGKAVSGAPAAGSGSPGQRADAGMLQLLSLFLLLLVFFIVLDAQTIRRADRAKAVAASVETRLPAFVIHPRLLGAVDPVASRSGPVLAADRLAGMGDLFTTAVAVAKVTVVTPGRLIEVRLPADALFLHGQAKIRPDRAGLIDRVVDSLRRSPPGQRIEVEALLAIDDTAVSQSPGPIPRAGALARALSDGGAPLDAVSVGVERGAGGSARFLFSVRDTERPAGGWR